MKRIYNVMVIGCGHMGVEHLRDIYYRENIRIAAVVDNDPERAKQTARRYSAADYGTDYRPFLESGKVDIAIIATYVSSHLDILRDCIRCGVHVLCEKPIALTLAEAELFCAEVQTAKTKVLVGHILRHNETYKRAAKLIQDGVIGSPIVMRMVQNHHTMNWDRYKRLLADCPPIVDCGVHYFDVMQWFTGEKIETVCGMKSTIDSDVPKHSYNYGIVTVKLSGGSVGYYEAGWSNTLASSNLKEFVGPKGRLSIILSDQRLQNREEGDLIEIYSYPEKEYRSINIRAPYKPAYNQLCNLIGMIEGTQKADPTIEEVYSSVRAAFTADRALREETVVRLNHDLPQEEVG